MYHLLLQAKEMSMKTTRELLNSGQTPSNDSYTNCSSIVDKRSLGAKLNDFNHVNMDDMTIA